MDHQDFILLQRLYFTGFRETCMPSSTNVLKNRYKNYRIAIKTTESFQSKAGHSSCLGYTVY